jgi:pimeloyl-ACP methyl ester carboxylesterase
LKIGDKSGMIGRTRGAKRNTARETPMARTIERQTCLAPDGVTLVYSAAGSGEPALVFVHGGLADRSFWESELRNLSADHRVIAVDLAGHGQSGWNRTKWGIPEFGADVCAVADAERLDSMILFGNSLGGPVAVEAALLLGDRVLGVVGVDTFQSLTYSVAPEEARQRAEAFRDDLRSAVKQMVKALFHPDADPAMVADAERRMMGTPPDAAHQMFLAMAGYNPSVSCRRLQVPLRAINGDLYPTDVAGVREVKADFDVIVMTHMGHYPMLERPAEFDGLVMDIVRALQRSA